MKMYIVVEEHFLRTGTRTRKYNWWYKDELENKSKKQKTIHSNYDLIMEVKEFILFNPDGKIMYKDISGDKLSLKESLKHELIKEQ